MITITEARVIQNKAQKRSLAIFLGCMFIFAVVCVGLFFVGELEFYIGLYLSLLVLVYIGYKVKMTDFLRPKAYEGEVTYFNVSTEQHKEIHTHQVGSKYDVYRVLVADMIVKDEKGKTRYKRFRYSKEYDDVKNGDRATVLRFVDKPVITFKDRDNL